MKSKYLFIINVIFVIFNIFNYFYYFLVLLYLLLLLLSWSWNLESWSWNINYTDLVVSILLARYIFTYILTKHEM